MKKDEPSKAFDFFNYKKDKFESPGEMILDLQSEVQDLSAAIAMREDSKAVVLKALSISTLALKIAGCYKAEQSS